MSKQNKPNTAKSFKIQFSIAILCICVAIYLLCIVGIALSIWRIKQFGINNFSDALQSPFLIAVCAFCIVLVTALLVKSEYAIDNENLISRYGFIKSKFAIKDITSIVLDTDSKKMTVFFGEQFIVLTTLPQNNEELVRAILAVKPDIEYSFTLTENKPQNTNE